MQEITITALPVEEEKKQLRSIIHLLLLHMKKRDTEIGKRLKLLRQEAGLKQADIAKLVGHSNTAVGRIERGEQTIDLKTILAYKKQFNVSADYIIDGVNNGNEDISDRLKFAEQYIDRLENILKNRT
tara:strand:+ start:91 stop:474 length:384 start_codon:yes stop_codon:yes gene_type:complete